MNESYIAKILEGIKMDNKDFYNAIYVLVKNQCEQINVLNNQVAELRAVLGLKQAENQAPSPTPLENAMNNFNR